MIQALKLVKNAYHVAISSMFEVRRQMNIGENAVRWNSHYSWLKSMTPPTGVSRELFVSDFRQFSPSRPGNIDCTENLQKMAATKFGVLVSKIKA